MITLIGAPKDSKREEVLATATALTDTNGRRVEWITLDWLDYNPLTNIQQPCEDGSHTHGFDSTIITIRPGRGMMIEVREGGYVTWQRNRLTQTSYTICQRTDNNMRLLASHYDEGRWRIREEHIRKEVEVMYNKLMDELKEDRVQKTNELGEPLYNGDGTPVYISAYEHRMNRLRGTKNKTYGIIVPEKPKVVSDDLVKQNQILLEQNALLSRQIQEQHSQIMSALSNANVMREGLAGLGGFAIPEYDRDSLMVMNPMSSLRKLAKETFAIESDNLSRKELVDKIMEIQSANKVTTKVE